MLIFVPVDMHNLTILVIGFIVTYLLLLFCCSLILYFSLFFSSAASTVEMSLLQQCPLFSCCGYCYGSCLITKQKGILFCWEIQIFYLVVGYRQQWVYCWYFEVCSSNSKVNLPAVAVLPQWPLRCKTCHL